MKLHILLISICLAGCVSTANVTNFPISQEKIDFDEISKRNLNPDDPIWNLKGRNEYMVSLESNDEITLFELLVESNQNQGFKTKHSDRKSRVVIGEKGLQLNEWSSVSGIYYRRLKGDMYQVYIRVDITQDVTGGWKENRAKQVANEICKLSSKCI